MRPNQQNNKQRSRGRNNNGRRGGGGNPLSRNYESNGPDVKIRGNASHIAEKYVQLARDAAAVGDGVMAENYLQHAEHYFRIILAAQGQYQPRAEQMTDTTPEEDEDTDQPAARETGQPAAVQPNGAAHEGETPEAEDEQEQRRPQRQRRQRRPRSEETTVADAGGNAETPQPAEAEAAPEAGGEDKPKRARRPRKKAGEDAAADSGELPAFLTAGREAAAE